MIILAASQGAPRTRNTTGTRRNASAKTTRRSSRRAFALNLAKAMATSIRTGTATARIRTRYCVFSCGPRGILTNIPQVYDDYLGCKPRCPDDQKYNWHKKECECKDYKKILKDGVCTEPCKGDGYFYKHDKCYCKDKEEVRLLFSCVSQAILIL